MKNSFSDVGVDIAKATLDFSFQDRSWTIPNTKASILKLLTQLEKQATSPLRVSCEATSRYGHLLISLCLARSLVVCELNPRSVRDFAKSQGHLAKSDRIDARVIAQFASISKPKAIEPNTWFHTQRARELHTRLRSLIDEASAQKNSLDQYRDPFIRRDIQSLLRVLEGRIKKLETELLTHVTDTPQHTALFNLLCEEKGVGVRTALAIMAHLPEIGHLNRQQVAALAGLAPFNRDSGTLRGKRCIQAGRTPLRNALYLAAVVAARYNPSFKDYYQALKDSGKPPKVALIAVARKLLIKLNSSAKNHLSPEPLTI